MPVMVVSTAIVFLALLRSAAVDTILVRNNITKEIMVEDMKEIEKKSNDDGKRDTNLVRT